jgi:hypothetical protein
MADPNCRLFRSQIADSRQKTPIRRPMIALGRRFL